MKYLKILSKYYPHEKRDSIRHRTNNNIHKKNTTTVYCRRFDRNKSKTHLYTNVEEKQKHKHLV